MNDTKRMPSFGNSQSNSNLLLRTFALWSHGILSLKECPINANNGSSFLTVIHRDSTECPWYANKGSSFLTVLHRDSKEHLKTSLNKYIVICAQLCTFSSHKQHEQFIQSCCQSTVPSLSWRTTSGTLYAEDKLKLLYVSRLTFTLFLNNLFMTITTLKEPNLTKGIRVAWNIVGFTEEEGADTPVLPLIIISLPFFAHVAQICHCRKVLIQLEQSTIELHLSN